MPRRDAYGVTLPPRARRPLPRGGPPAAKLANTAGHLISSQRPCMQLVYRKLQGMRAEQVTAQALAKLDAEANAAARSSFGQILRFFCNTAHERREIIERLTRETLGATPGACTRRRPVTAPSERRSPLLYFYWRIFIWHLLAHKDSHTGLAAANLQHGRLRAPHSVKRIRRALLSIWPLALPHESALVRSVEKKVGDLCRLGRHVRQLRRGRDETAAVLWVVFPVVRLVRVAPVCRAARRFDESPVRRRFQVQRQYMRSL